MLVSSDEILPSQDFLKPDTIKFILSCIKNGELDKLPPDPIVRNDQFGNLIAIDGHNLIAVKYKLKEKINVHLATNADDGLPTNSQANFQRNKDLKGKFDTVISSNERLQKSGITSFGDLLAHYEELFP